jgi:hypothetical protein
MLEATDVLKASLYILFHSLEAFVSLEGYQQYVTGVT